MIKQSSFSKQVIAVDSFRLMSSFVSAVLLNELNQMGVKIAGFVAIILGRMKSRKTPILFHGV